VPGTYTLTLQAAGSGIQDEVGNLLQADASESWTMLQPGVSAQIAEVTPDPRNEPVDQLQISFSAAVSGFDLADLTLARDGGPNLLAGTETLQTTDQITWSLSGLAGLTAAEGTYTLTLTAAGSGIQDGQGNPLSFDAVESWQMDTTRPQATIVPVSPDPRSLAVDSVQIVFSEPVSGLDLGDLSLARDGGPNLLAGTETLETTDNITWTLSGLAELTGSGGAQGFVAYNDHIAGAGTHANTTRYSAAPGQTSSGVLKDISTGQPTGVTLTVSDSGNLSYASTSGVPAAGTDAYQMFNGYVYFGSGTYASIELRGPGHTYTYTFSGLDAGGGTTYDFHGTAVRGNSDYTDRWTLVSLVGAESFTADHSTGLGVVTSETPGSGLQPNQVALWTGHNSAPGQGFVAGWTRIDPGPDGQFQVVCDQYLGPTPGVGDGTADGSKGYGLTGIRLEEVPASGIPGQYALALSSLLSGIQDAAGNPLGADVLELWTIGTPAPDTDPPTVSLVLGTGQFTNTPLAEAFLLLSEPVTGLDLSDLTLSRNGGPNLLDGRQTLTMVTQSLWRLGELGPLTAEEGTGGRRSGQPAAG